MVYPSKSDIERHKKELFTAMIQYEAGLISKELLENSIRVLQGDARLVAKNLKVK